MYSMDASRKGAAHPLAFQNTANLLPPPVPATKRVWPERTANFNAALDGINRASMPAPPPRSKRAGWFDTPAAERAMPAKRARAGTGSAEDASEHSRNTSDYTMHQTVHATDRMRERELLRRELQACLKHDTRPRLTGSDRWRFEWDGLTLITDASKKLAITAFRGPSSRPRYVLAESEAPFDLFHSVLLAPPETPRSPSVSTPRDSSRSRSRSVSASRQDGQSANFVGFERGLAVLPTVREYAASAPDDMIEAIKGKARVVNDIALRGGARNIGVLWDCKDCGSKDNVAWMHCLGCKAAFPEEAIAKVKHDAKATLEQPYDLATATEANPHRLGTMAGYVGGRIATVREDLACHPAAFEELKPLLPAPPSRDKCKLPNQQWKRIPNVL